MKEVNILKTCIILLFLSLLNLQSYGQGVVHRNSKSQRNTVSNSNAKKAQKPLVSSPDGHINGHGYVDLGLSVKWATCNIGASSFEDYGEYFAWGEINPKLEYTEDNYKYYEGNYKYTNIGNDIKGTQYDTARSKWGESWRMPSRAECQELISKCKWTWIVLKNVYGYKIEGPNGRSIFLPASGSYGLNQNNDWGPYWTSSYYSKYETKHSAFILGIYKPYSSGTNRLFILDSERHYGYPIRPVL